MFEGERSYAFYRLVCLAWRLVGNDSIQMVFGGISDKRTHLHETRSVPLDAPIAADIPGSRGVGLQPPVPLAAFQSYSSFQIVVHSRIPIRRVRRVPVYTFPACFTVGRWHLAKPHLELAICRFQPVQSIHKL